MHCTFKTKIAFALCALTMLFCSCSKKEDKSIIPTQQEVQANIVGKWKLLQYDGTDALTNSKAVWTFANDGKGTMSLSKFIPEALAWMWLNHVPTQYQISENNLTLSTPMVKHFITLNTFDSRMMNLSIDKSVDNTGHSSESATARNCSFAKITADYSKDIIGLWECIGMSGDETYGNAEARIAYHANGTYTYYKKQADEWRPSTDVVCEYFVDGDWLATRWLSEVGGEYDHEWWDIDGIKDGIMVWSALRERIDGSRFTATFTWMKVQ